LPSNIYGTDGPWESYSTPSRDARLKAAFRELHGFVADTVFAHEAGEPRIDYGGDTAQLIAEYQRVWDEIGTSDCAIAYESSDGTPVELSLDDIMDRLFALSFDPYHCPEVRWGAPIESAELSSCPGHADFALGSKMWWYEAEQRLRNRIDRDYDANTTLCCVPGY